ncbi:metal ABC transporter permease [Anaeromyxobacter oryzae]|uniref:Membrane protein n=1 Tax=Anaeromyxobacter oryzae TaxID=2918170 RepID=A0ABM7WQ25_9BACT|nr:metal ABC transporter permease [Anaeromyxobacter oryzae]BDG01558.1 membrane protein [Anaeromyxobacter oryzae]
MNELAQPGKLAEFLSAREIWEIPLAASVVAGALLGFLGVYVVLRRTVFVSAALTQLSTLGLVATLLVEERVHIETEHASEQLAVAILFSVAGALVLGALRPRRLPAEASVGGAWVAASAAVVLGVSQLVHAAHDLGGMVFGNAVAVPAGDLMVIAVVALVCTAVHALFAKELAFVSFDPETALSLGMPVARWDALLFLTIGLAIPVTARALGALPVFAFLTLPAAAALLARVGFRPAFALAGGIGVISAAVGYVLSWLWEIPTGATMVVIAALFLVPGALMRRGRG